MRYLKKEEDMMLELNKEFQRKLFDKLIKGYGRKMLAEKLGKSPSIFYLYRNNHVRAIPHAVLCKAVKLAGTPKKEFEKNILKRFSAEKSIRDILSRGITFRRKQIKENLSIDFGAYSLLEKKNGPFLDILTWLNKNLWIEKLKKQGGIIKNIQLDEVSKKDIQVSYQVYNRREKNFKKYIIFLPRILRINEDLCYFLGLLYGDGLNGARVGISNKDEALIDWTANFLRIAFEKNRVRSYLIIHNNSKIETEKLYQWLESISDHSSIYLNPKAKGDYVYNIFITNNILRRILDNLIDNLNGLFYDITSEQRGAFLAGFFDAEGNVNKLDKNFRWSQKMEEKVKTIMGLLKNEGYHVRYDGCNLLIGYKKEFMEDLEHFEKQILPFLKHSKKTKQAKELLRGFFVEDSYKPIVRIISKSPGITQKEIAKVIKRVKCTNQLAALTEAGFIMRKRSNVNESFKYHVTTKGIIWIE